MLLWLDNPAGINHAEDLLFMNALEQLRQHTKVVADTGDFAAMDLLVPGVGDIVGGSQREERLDRLVAAMQAHGLDLESYGWYIDTRRFGTVPHAGFGLGFERLLMFVTGEGNIRDVIAYPRTPGHA